SNGSADVRALPLSEPRKPFPVVRTPFDERDAQFSTDGRWIAYQSDESGRPEIYIQPFPGPGRKWRISTNGGTQVRWREDETELFYVATDNRLMSVPVVLHTVDDVPQIGAAVPLFMTHIRLSGNIARQQYVVARDGQRFLLNNADESATQPIRLILNW